jgi:hypothetical protein
MEDARPYASLSSGLLARKGAAKPAMRPQSYTTYEDLGWNDMGEDLSSAPEIVHPEHVPSSIAALTPAPRLSGSPIEDSFEQEEIEIDSAHEHQPSPVAVQHRALRVSLEIAEPAEIEEQPKARQGRTKAKVVALPRRAEAVAGRRSAFTLRLDAERHLRLRLACAVAGRSAQQIVTDALDRALSEIPEVEALAARAAGAHRN